MLAKRLDHDRDAALQAEASVMVALPVGLGLDEADVEFEANEPEVDGVAGRSVNVSVTGAAVEVVVLATARGLTTASQGKQESIDRRELTQCSILPLPYLLVFSRNSAGSTQQRQ